MPTAPPYALPDGTDIGGYRISGFVGAGGFGIVYEAHNPVTKERVAIKEYYPRQMVSRQGNTVILHNEQQQEMHRAVLRRFEVITRPQVGFDDKNNIKVKHSI